ncbi:MAG: efflux RND transporter periplasmic adaptor subunit [Bacteroidaceae bacterium]|nr:efflux RND transporter periplasmic adaptor subunit [Bacteroidaceae bacterium]
MKKNLTIIALAAVALFASCSGSEKTEQVAPVAVQIEKPKVKIEKVTTEAVAQLEEYATTVEAEVKNNIIPNSPLRIQKILVEVGDYVKKGQQVVQLDASSLDQLKLQYNNQMTNFKRIEELYKIGGTSKSEYENMKMQLDVTKKNLDNRLENTVLLSPIDGVVSARNYDDGDMYNGQPILVVEQISPVKMKINISETRFAQTNKKLDVTLKFEAYGDEEFKGNIDIIYPTISAATHTFPVEIKIANNNHKIRPGMYGKAVVNFGTKEHVVVPDQAVIKQAGSGDYYVYTYENGKVYNNKVELGRRLGNRYEVISGVASGSQVVVAGKENLANEKEVEVIE